MSFMHTLRALIKRLTMEASEEKNGIEKGRLKARLTRAEISIEFAEHAKVRTRQSASIVSRTWR
jgi:hypothetical protein